MDFGCVGGGGLGIPTKGRAQEMRFRCKGFLASLGVKGQASSGGLLRREQHWACVELNEVGCGVFPQAPAPQLRAHLLGSKKLSSSRHPQAEQKE